MAEHLELFDLIKRLKEEGITHFKQGDLELTIAPNAVKTPPADIKPVSLEIAPSEPESQPPHIVQQMKSLLKLSDEDLIDQLFPLPRPSDEAIN